MARQKGNRMEFQQRLEELVRDAEKQAPKSVYAALHMTLGAWLEGKHSQFAKHCCRFSPLALKSAEAEVDPAPATEGRESIN